MLYEQIALTAHSLMILLLFSFHSSWTKKPSSSSSSSSTLFRISRTVNWSRMSLLNTSSTAVRSLPSRTLVEGAIVFVSIVRVEGTRCRWGCNGKSRRAVAPLRNSFRRPLGRFDWSAET